MTEDQANAKAHLHVEWVVTDEVFLRGVVEQFVQMNKSLTPGRARWQGPVISLIGAACSGYAAASLGMSSGVTMARVILVSLAIAGGWAALRQLQSLLKPGAFQRKAARRLITSGVVEQPIGRHRVTIANGTFEEEWIDGGHFSRLPASAIRDVVPAGGFILLCSGSVVRACIPRSAFAAAFPAADPVEAVRSTLAAQTPSFAPPTHRTTLPVTKARASSPPSDAPPAD